MLKGLIPLQVDPRKLADAGAALEGNLPLEQLERLTGSVANADGSVHVRLVFGRDEQRTVTFRSELKVEVKMICQRCLELVSLPIHSECEYAVIHEGASSQHLPKHYEVLEVGEETLGVKELVEDELLLALPIVPLHASDVCQAPGPETTSKSQENFERSNPFSVLAQLKRDPKD